MYKDDEMNKKTSEKINFIFSFSNKKKKKGLKEKLKSQINFDWSTNWTAVTFNIK